MHPSWAELSEDTDEDSNAERPLPPHLGLAGPSSEAQGSDDAAGRAGFAIHRPTWPTVPEALQRSVQPKAKASTSPFQDERLWPTLVHALEMWDRHREPLPTEADLEALTNFYLDKDLPHLHASKRAISKITGVDRLNLDGKLSLLAESLLKLELADQAVLERTLADSDAECVCYLDLCRYDETPLKVGQQQQVSTMMSNTRAAEGLAGIQPPEPLDASPPPMQGLSFYSTPTVS